MAKNQYIHDYALFQSNETENDLTLNETKLELYKDVEEHVQGEIRLSENKTDAKLGEPGFNTLDEPIKDTILRDLKTVGLKFWYVAVPIEKKTLLKEWDLWGPLMICTLMGMIMQGTKVHSSDEGGQEFSQIFLIVSIGSVIVTLNSKLLGGNISFFQSVCVLGYCLLPIAIALVLCQLISVMYVRNTYLFHVRFFINMLGFAMAVYASVRFLGDSQKPGRKALAVYPICFFYFVISCLTLSSSRL